jgi:hypothetical protein
MAPGGFGSSAGGRIGVSGGSPPPGDIFSGCPPGIPVRSWVAGAETSSSGLPAGQISQATTTSSTPTPARMVERLRAHEESCLEDMAGKRTLRLPSANRRSYCEKNRSPSNPEPRKGGARLRPGQNRRALSVADHHPFLKACSELYALQSRRKPRGAAGRDFPPRSTYANCSRNRTSFSMRCRMSPMPHWIMASRSRPMPKAKPVTLSG